MMSRTKTLLYLLFDGQITKRKNRLINLQNLLRNNSLPSTNDICVEIIKLNVEIETLENIEQMIYNTLYI